jgi:hypothetical protein
MINAGFRSLFRIIFAIVVASLPLGAADPAKPEPPRAARQENAPLLDVAVSTSRSETIAGSGFGVSAEILNQSNGAVFLNRKDFTMTPPPELDPGLPGDYFATFSGPYRDATLKALPKAPPDDPLKIVRLEPGDKVVAFWAWPDPGTKPNWLKQEVALLTFLPGEYTMRIVGLYWTDPKSAAVEDLNYRSVATSVKVTVVAPQHIILFGAIIGGIVAFLLLPNQRLHPNKITLSGFARELPGRS